jgi:hypothetical protein
VFWIDHDVAMKWRHDAACIDDRELARAVTARLGSTPERGRARIVIDGEITPSASGWTAAIRTTDARGHVLGQRELHETGADCHAIDDTLVLVIALIVDPDLLAEQAAPLPREPWQYGAEVSALVARGLIPGFGFGTSITATIGPPWGSIEISGVVWPRDHAEAAPGGAEMLQLTGGVAVCPRLVGPVSACVGAQAGELRARGFGYDQNLLEHELVVDGTSELRLDLKLGKLGVRLGAGAWVPLLRPRFVFARGDANVMVFQPAAAAVVSEIAFWVRF